MQVIMRTSIDEGPSYNEAKVRFHFIDPLLRALGYGVDNNTYVEFEENLSYPYYHIGHRSKKDLPLGRADYRAGLKEARGSFIIEAKAGSVAITPLAVEQAHSYAAHAQVGANYFVLCNGFELHIYETLSGPAANPIACMPLSNLNDRYHEIENILAPRNLESHCKVL